MSKKPQPAAGARWTTHSPFSPRFELETLPIALGLLLDLRVPQKRSKAQLAKLQAKFREAHAIAEDLHRHYAAAETRMALRRVLTCLARFGGTEPTPMAHFIKDVLIRPSVIHDIEFAREAVMREVDKRPSKATPFGPMAKADVQAALNLNGRRWIQWRKSNAHAIEPKGKLLDTAKHITFTLEMLAPSDATRLLNYEQSRIDADLQRGKA